MSLSTGMRIGLLVYGFLVITKGAHGGIIVPPSNAVATLNDQVVFYCEGSMYQGTWSLSANGIQEVLIVKPSCLVNTGFEANYKTDSTGGTNVCNLIVTNITMEQAGIYRCNEQASMSALLTVIDSSPFVTFNGSTTIIAVENETVMIECSSNYNGSISSTYSLQPYFYWTNSSGENISSSYDSTTEKKAVSRLTITAGRENISSFTCHVYLQLVLPPPAPPPSNAGYANNTPSANISATSVNVEILYYPSKPDISMAYKIIAIDGVACEVGVLTCNSSGNPQPTYEWFDTEENVNITTDQTFDLAEVNRNYSCVAKNTIRSVDYNESSIHVYKKQADRQYCRFPHSESTWHNVTGCDNGTCSCSNGYDGLNLTCNTDSYPNASFEWIGADQRVIKSKSYTNIAINGLYRCTAYFNQSASNYTGNVFFANGSSETNVTECCAVLDLVLSVIIPFLLKSLIFFVIFIVCLNLNDVFGVIMTSRFHWLKQLQHCSMDEALEMTLCICFAIGCLAFGLVLIPVLITIAFCSGSKGPDNAEHEMHGKRNQEGQKGENNGPYENERDDAHTAGSMSKWMIVLMWCFTTVALIPIAFIIVFFEYCNQMHYEVV